MPAHRLTKSDRRFIRQRILGDVPQTDYSGQARALVREAAAANLPADARAVYAKHPELFRTDHYVEHMPDGCRTYAVAAFDLDKAPATLRKKVLALGKKHAAQKVHRDKLHTTITGALECCPTVESLKRQYPEWSKYAPEVAAPIAPSKLPSVDVISELRRAGWPAESTQPKE